MLHMHNASTLLGSKRHAIYYPPTGTGRDSYIMQNNGGTNIYYRPQGVPELGNYMKFGNYNRQYKPASGSRMQKYISDGSGRDKYVVSGHGGQFTQNQECSAMLKKFSQTMRSNSVSHSASNATGNGWRRANVVAQDNQLSKTQRLSHTRLSEPKKTNRKYEDMLNEYRKQMEKKNN